MDKVCLLSMPLAPQPGAYWDGASSMEKLSSQRWSQHPGCQGKEAAEILRAPSF